MDDESMKWGDEDEDDEPKTFPCPYDPERAAAVFAADMTAATIGLFGAKLAEITGVPIGASPEPRNGEAPDEAELVSGDGDGEPVSANGDARLVSAGGNERSPYVALAAGQRVRYCGTAKPRHATTGTIESVTDHRGYFDHVAGRWIPGVGHGRIDYRVRWDDGTTNEKWVVPDRRPSIEALDPPAPQEESGAAGAAELGPDDVLILEALGESPEGLTRSQIKHTAFGGQPAAGKIAILLAKLLDRGLVERRMQSTGGRPSEVWTLVEPPDGDATDNGRSREDGSTTPPPRIALRGVLTA
jgi:hypothetical protein